MRILARSQPTQRIFYLHRTRAAAGTGGACGLGAVSRPAAPSGGAHPAGCARSTPPQRGQTVPRSDRPGGPRGPPRLCQPGRPLGLAAGSPASIKKTSPRRWSTTLQDLGVPSRPSWHRIFNDLVPLTHGGSSLTIFERGAQGLEVRHCNPYRITVV